MRTRFTFDPDQLRELATDIRQRYRDARPFPHAVLDDFLSEAVLDQVLAEFPTPHQAEWWRFDSDKERKLASTDTRMMGPTTAALLAELNGAVFLDFLRDLTGVQGLVPDPHLYGGGLHQIEPGGFLDIHADFNLHPVTRLERRLNLLLYLNRGWRDEWGGALELWNEQMVRCDARILPLFNRCVIFTTSDTSYHGHPAPLASPPGVTRKSIALYYYSLPDTAGLAGSDSPHNTLFQRQRSPAQRIVRELVPPVAVKGAGRLRRAWRGRNRG